MTSRKLLVLGLVSKGGCGKDSCSKYLAKKYGGKEIVMSNLIGRALKLFHIYPDRVAVSWFIRVARKRFGKDILAKAVVHEIQMGSHPFYVLNGIRIKKEVDLLRKSLGKNFILVDIVCDDQIRFKRIRTRQEITGVKKDNVDVPLEEFLKWEQKIGNEKEIPAIEKKVDYVIDNNGAKRELLSKLDNLIANLNP